MADSRYPYPAAGRRAALPFALLGAAGGVVLSSRISSAPPLLLNAILWAVLFGFASYIVFASQGPNRPPSILQAAAADGVVAALVALLPTLFVDLLAAGGAGTSSTGLSTSTIVSTIAVSLPSGAVAGGLTGLLLPVMLGRAPFERIPPQRSGSKRSSRKRSKRR